MSRTGHPSIAAEETLEMYASMEAADKSKRRGGAAEDIKQLPAKAGAEAATKP